MPLTLIALLSLTTLPICAPAFADDSSNSSTSDWPTEVYFPQRPLPAPPKDFPNAGKKQAVKSAGKTENGKKQKKPGFLARRREENRRPPSEDQIINVGPRENPVRPEPLLRLGVAIQADDAVIPSGFYLIHVSGEGKPEIASLNRQDKVLMRFKLHEVAAPDENVAKTGTPSPITQVHPNMPPILIAEARLSPDQKSMTFRVTFGGQRYESEAFPVATDLRPVLAH